MDIKFEHKANESAGGSVETTVEIKTSDVMGGMGSGDDGGDSDKRGA